MVDVRPRLDPRGDGFAVRSLGVGVRSTDPRPCIFFLSSKAFFPISKFNGVTILNPELALPDPTCPCPVVGNPVRKDSYVFSLDVCESVNDKFKDDFPEVILIFSVIVVVLWLQLRNLRN